MNRKKYLTKLQKIFDHITYYKIESNESEDVKNMYLVIIMIIIIREFELIFFSCDFIEADEVDIIHDEMKKYIVQSFTKLY